MPCCCAFTLDAPGGPPCKEAPGLGLLQPPYLPQTLPGVGPHPRRPDCGSPCGPMYSLVSRPRKLMGIFSRALPKPSLPSKTSPESGPTGSDTRTPKMTTHSRRSESPAGSPRSSAPLLSHQSAAWTLASLSHPRHFFWQPQNNLRKVTGTSTARDPSPPAHGPCSRAPT